jgi:hypothetical protein
MPLVARATRDGTVPMARHGTDDSDDDPDYDDHGNLRSGVDHASDGTDDSDRVTDLMIAAGISPLPSMSWTLAETKETLAHVYRAMRKVRDL